MMTSIISNEEINDIMKIVKPLEKSGLLIKSVTETIKKEGKNKKTDLLVFFLDLLDLLVCY